MAQSVGAIGTSAYHLVGATLDVLGISPFEILLICAMALLIMLAAKACTRLRGSVAPAVAERDLLLLRDAPRSDGEHLPLILPCNYQLAACLDAMHTATAAALAALIAAPSTMRALAAACTASCAASFWRILCCVPGTATMGRADDAAAISHIRVDRWAPAPSPIDAAVAARAAINGSTPPVAVPTSCGYTSAPYAYAPYGTPPPPMAMPATYDTPPPPPVSVQTPYGTPPPPPVSVQTPYGTPPPPVSVHTPYNITPPPAVAVPTPYSTSPPPPVSVPTPHGTPPPAAAVRTPYSTTPPAVAVVSPAPPAESGGGFFSSLFGGSSKPAPEPVAATVVAADGRLDRASAAIMDLRGSRVVQSTDALNATAYAPVAASGSSSAAASAATSGSVVGSTIGIAFDDAAAAAGAGLSVSVPPSDSSPMSLLSKIGITTRPFQTHAEEQAAREAQAVAQAAVIAAHHARAQEAAARRSPDTKAASPPPVEGWPTRFGTSTYTADAAAALANTALSATSTSTTPYGRVNGQSLLVGASPMVGAGAVPAEKVPTGAIGGDGALAVDLAVRGMAPLPFTSSRVAEVKSQLREVLSVVAAQPTDARRSSQRRFALQAAVEAQWSGVWSQVDLPALLRDTSLAARELLAYDPALVSHTASEMRACFESLEAVFVYYTSFASDEPAIEAARAATHAATPGKPTPTKATPTRSPGVATPGDADAGETTAADRPQSRTLGVSGWLAFCADVGLGALADLSWFAPPNDIEAAVPHARREVCERALFNTVLERRNALKRASGRRHRSELSSPKIGLSFSEFLQALLLACWRRVAVPSPAERAATMTAGASSSATSGAPNAGAMRRAVREIVTRGILPHANRVDTLPFRRALAASGSLHAAAFALQPALVHIFEHCCDAAPGGGGAQRNNVMQCSLGDYSRMLVASGVLDDEAHGFRLSHADIAGAFVASLPGAPQTATALGYEGFVEATLRLAAAGVVTPPASGASVAAAAAAAVASPSLGGGVVPQPVTGIDDTVVLARLPSMVARQLLAVLPASKQAADLAIASVESAALNRARAGEPDPLLAGSPTFGFDDPFSA